MLAKSSTEKGTLTAGTALFTEYLCNVEGVISDKLADASMIGLENMPIKLTSLRQMASSLVIVTSVDAVSPTSKIVIIGRSKCKLTRLIIESAHIEKFGDTCVRKSSLSLSKKELEFLRVR